MAMMSKDGSHDVLVGLSGTVRDLVGRRAGAMALAAGFRLSKRGGAASDALRAR
jgi:hypothetical protein